jgi:hypothetical protein
MTTAPQRTETEGLVCLSITPTRFCSHFQLVSQLYIAVLPLWPSSSPPPAGCRRCNPSNAAFPLVVAWSWGVSVVAGLAHSTAYRGAVLLMSCSFLFFVFVEIAESNHLHARRNTGLATGKHRDKIAALRHIPANYRV